MRPPKPKPRFSYQLQARYVNPVLFKSRGGTTNAALAAAATPKVTANINPVPTPTVPHTNPVPSSREARRIQVQNDELGKIILENVQVLQQVGWRGLIRKLRQRGDIQLHPEVTKNHPAGPMLKRLEKEGVPAIMTTPHWSQDTIDQRVSHGSHQSCLQYLEFLREELLEFTQKGFWLVLPYEMVRSLQRLGHLLGLRVSPMGVVPQRDRRPRLIVDLSFYDINQETINLAPKEAMQFGRTLERILYMVRHSNPNFGPVHLGKVDLADGFYRLWLNDSAVPKLAVALPKFPGEEQLLALPLVLPMGWVESPPWFCAATETVADLANNWPHHVEPPPHPLETVANTPPEEDTDATHSSSIALAAKQPTVPTAVPQHPPSAAQQHLGPPAATQLAPSAPSESTGPQDPPPAVLRPFSKPVRHTDVYVDDFIQACQGNRQARLNHLRKLLHAIDLVFRPLDSADSPHRKHVPSLKKLLKGDAHLSTRKVVLGWLIDTVRQTLELPPHRIQRLQELFDSLRGKTRVSVKLWHKVLGELRSMAIGIPGSRGLFSLLQEGLRHTDKHRIKITPAMRHQLEDFEHLTQSLAERPTELSEIVPDHPVAVGPHDASGRGMGGVWLPATTHSNIPPLLWRAKFPPTIQQRLVSTDNPDGDITNSDLELAGLLAQQDIIAQAVNCRGRTIVPLGDNIPSVVWHHKHSTTTTGAAAYLLRLNSIHQRHFRYVSKASYIPGPANQMADDCSRLWHLSDSQLLAHFNSRYPQEKPGQLVHLRPEMLFSLTSALQMKRPELGSVLNEPPTRTAIGGCGKPSLLPSMELTPTSTASPHTSTFLFSKFSPPKYDEANSLPAADLSNLNVFRTTYGPWPRRYEWGPNSA